MVHKRLAMEKNFLKICLAFIQRKSADEPEETDGKKKGKKKGKEKKRWEKGQKGGRKGKKTKRQVIAMKQKSYHHRLTGPTEMGQCYMQRVLNTRKSGQPWMRATILRKSMTPR